MISGDAMLSRVRGVDDSALVLLSSGPPEQAKDAAKDAAPAHDAARAKDAQQKRPRHRGSKAAPNAGIKRETSDSFLKGALTVLAVSKTGHRCPEVAHKKLAPLPRVNQASKQVNNPHRHRFPTLQDAAQAPSECSGGVTKKKARANHHQRSSELPRTGGPVPSRPLAPQHTALLGMQGE